MSSNLKLLRVHPYIGVQGHGNSMARPKAGNCTLTKVQYLVCRIRPRVPGGVTKWNTIVYILSKFDTRDDRVYKL